MPEQKLFIEDWADQLEDEHIGHIYRNAFKR
jgi:hypothetical protein